MMSSPKLARTVKNGVRISKETGGAYADVREVIESELARIREELAKTAKLNGTKRTADNNAHNNNGYNPAVSK